MFRLVWTKRDERNFADLYQYDPKRQVKMVPDLIELVASSQASPSNLGRDVTSPAPA
jgi:hypothetical protein